MLISSFYGHKCSGTQLVFHQHICAQLHLLLWANVVQTFCSMKEACKISVSLLSKMLLVKCPWNWHLKPISPTFYKQLLLQYAFTKKLQIQTVIREKLCKTLLRTKGACKMLVKLRPWINFTNIFTLSFYTCRFRKCKKTDILIVFFTLLGSTHIKAVRRTFMKLTPSLVKAWAANNSRRVTSGRWWSDEKSVRPFRSCWRSWAVWYLAIVVLEKKETKA